MQAQGRDDGVGRRGRRRHASRSRRCSCSPSSRSCAACRRRVARHDDRVLSERAADAAAVVAAAEGLPRRRARLRRGARRAGRFREARARAVRRRRAHARRPRPAALDAHAHQRRAARATSRPSAPPVLAAARRAVRRLRARVVRPRRPGRGGLRRGARTLPRLACAPPSARRRERDVGRGGGIVRRPSSTARRSSR